MYKSLVVNLLAGSGAGKSTNAARLFSMLKDKRIEVELVTEWVKDMVWEGRTKIFECQPYIFGKQLYKIIRLQNNVDVIITDSPILLSAIYDKEQNLDFRKYILTQFNKFNNLNFYLDRVVPFNPNGRNEKSIDEAIMKDRQLLDFLYENNIKFDIVDGNSEGCNIILDKILEKLNNN